MGEGGVLAFNTWQIYHYTFIILIQIMFFPVFLDGFLDKFH